MLEGELKIAPSPAEYAPVDISQVRKMFDQPMGKREQIVADDGIDTVER